MVKFRSNRLASPSSGETHGHGQINLVPLLNLFTVLVPFLLTSVVLVQIGFLHLYLPVEGSGKRLAAAAREETLALNLIIKVSDDTFTLRSDLTIPEFTPIPRTHMEWLARDSSEVTQVQSLADYSTLIDYLSQIKKLYQDENEITIMAKDHIGYATLIAVMDCARLDSLFMVISFSRWEE